MRQDPSFGPGQARGFGDARCQPRPADGACDRSAEIGAVAVGFDQGRAQLREQTNLVADRSCVPQDCVFLARLGAAEHASYGAIEQRDAVVGEPCRGIQHRRDQGRATAERRQRSQVLGAEAAAFTRELA
ncbi:MAG: hypothetical protein M3Y41_04405 [Pseudomonadota bacterium]|nr:hypothetical protein [Pseudomonadota bacterium]